MTPLGVTGKEAEHLLDEIGITVNKNAIPFDTLPPNTASGIRIGTPADDVPRLRAGRDAGRRPDHHRRDRAPRRAGGPGHGSPARSARSSPGSRSRACPPRDGAEQQPDRRGPCIDDLHPDSRHRPRARSSSSSCLPALIALVPDAVRPALRHPLRDRRSARCPPGQHDPGPARRGPGGLRRRSSWSPVRSSSSTRERTFVPVPLGFSADRRSRRCCSAARSPPGSARSTTCSICGRATQLLGQVAARRRRRRAGDHDRLHRQPVRPGARSASPRVLSRPG